MHNSELCSTSDASGSPFFLDSARPSVKIRGMSMRGLVPTLVLVISLGFGGAFWGCSAPQEPSLCHTAIVHPEAEEEDEEEEEDEDEPRMVRPVRPLEWLQLIVRAQEGGQATQECTGTAISSYEPTQECREAEEERRRENPELYQVDDTPQVQELTEESVIDRRLTNRHRLIWVITHRYPNGDALGPIALVERRIDNDEETDDIHVLAVGSLRARSEQPRLRLLTVREPLVTVTERLICENEEDLDPDEGVDLSQCERRQEILVSEGIRCRNNSRVSSCELTRELRRELRDDESDIGCTDDEDVTTCWRRRQMIVVEGETCIEPDEEEQSSMMSETPDEGEGEEEEEEAEEVCNRSADFMFRDGDRFVQAELHHIAGRCLGRAQMRYSERTEVPIQGGWQRRFDLAASYEFGGARMVLHQQVVAVDFDPRQPEVPPRPFRRAEADNHWFLFQGRFVTPNISLWERMLLRHGSLQVTEEHASR
jgi:hypothetical protein